MKHQKIFFMVDDLLFKVDQPEISLKKIRLTKVKIENEEYKELRKEFNEDFFNIKKVSYGWLITEKE
jgi:hypothetical protein